MKIENNIHEEEYYIIMLPYGRVWGYSIILPSFVIELGDILIPKLYQASCKMRSLLVQVCGERYILVNCLFRMVGKTPLLRDTFGPEFWKVVRKSTHSFARIGRGFFEENSEK